MRKGFLFITVFFLSQVVSAQIQQGHWKLMDREMERTRREVHKYLPVDTILNLGSSRLHMHYDAKPGKPYLLLLHGMGMNGRTNWMNQIPELSQKFNLLVPDLVYFGESTTDSSNVSPEFQARQIRKAIDMLEIHDTIHIVGFSYGGLVAAILNSQFSSRIGSIVIVDAPLKYYTVAMADSMARAVGVESINRIITPTNKKEFKAMQKAVMSYSLPIPGFIRKKVIRYVFLPSRELREKQLDYLAQHEQHYLQMDYKLQEHRVMFVWGAKDGVIPVHVGKMLQQKHPGSKLVIFENAKHDATFNESKKLNKEICLFIRK